MTRLSLPCLVTALLPLAAAPQDQPLRGPVLGFVFDAGAGGLRAIRGLPGASTLSPLLDAGAPLARAAISPQQDYALVVQADNSAVAVLRMPPGPISLQPIDGVPAGPDQIAISPSGRAAALYYAAEGAIRVVTGLPGAPSAGQPVQLPGAPSALAASDDGIALVAAGEGDAASVVAVAGGEQHFVLNAGSGSALAFLAGGRDALVADSRENRLYLVRDVTGAAIAVPIAGAEQGIAGPVAIGVSRDQRRVLVASGSGAITLLELEAGTAASISCQCEPAGLERLAGDSVFRLTGVSANPLLLLDGDASPPRIVFVPPAEGGAQ